MQIKFSPQRRDDTLTVSKQGDTLTINGVAYDFSFMPDGSTLPAAATDCAFIVGNIERIGNDLQITLILPHREKPTQTASSPPPMFNPADGILELPQ